MHFSANSFEGISTVKAKYFCWQKWKKKKTNWGNFQ